MLRRLLILGAILWFAVQPATAQPATQPSGDRGFPDLVAGLRATPGCLDVVTTTRRLSNGQDVIFAFFENKQAALKWYYSPMHKGVMKLLGEDADSKEAPMKDVPEGVPVMAVASITFGGKPAIEGSPIPFSQISIELYTPLSGGLNFGGGFSPDKFRAARNAPATQPANR